MDILHIYYSLPSAAVTNSRDSSICRVDTAAKIDTFIDTDIYIDTDTDVYIETHLPDIYRDS